MYNLAIINAYNFIFRTNFGANTLYRTDTIIPNKYNSVYKNTHPSPILLQTFSEQLAIDNCFMFHILSLMSR